MSNWLSIHIQGDDLEEKCSLLFEYGIVGNTISSDGSACCFYQSEDSQIKAELLEEISRLGLTISKTEIIEETNWTQNCEALFEPVEVGSLKIIPLKTYKESDSSDSMAAKEILIIPGTGFGTGHHATTFNLLKLLQHPDLQAKPPKSVLDAGTGSGILAIGACRLFDSSVDAYENDPLAVENAQENVSLNKLQGRVTLYCESVHRCEAKYDLVVANLYAELLEILCSHLIERGNEKCHFLLSGIRADLTKSVLDKYEGHGLRCVEKIVSDGWAALMLER